MPMGHSRWTCFLHTETLPRSEHADADVDIKESLLLGDSIMTQGCWGVERAVDMALTDTDTDSN